MVSIPAELDNLFTFLSFDDDLSLLWEGLPKKVNDSLPATSFLLSRIEHLPGWTFEPQISNGDAIVWSNNRDRAILMILQSGAAELRLHETEDQYLGAWKYLHWIFDLAFN